MRCNNKLLAEKFHLARIQAETVDTLVFFTVRQQNLGTHANSEKRFFSGSPNNHLGEPAFSDFLHAVSGRTLAWKHHPVGIVDIRRTGGHLHPITIVYMFQRLGH